MAVLCHGIAAGCNCVVSHQASNAFEETQEACPAPHATTVPTNTQRCCMSCDDVRTDWIFLATHQASKATEETQEACPAPIISPIPMHLRLLHAS